MSLIERLGQKLEPLMIYMGLLSPIATLPQIYKLYFSHTAHSHALSLTTWILYTLIAFTWTLYGFYHKNPTIWLGNLFSFLADLTIVFGIIKFAGFTL